ncbi:hypothetical protein B0H65DRAFT_107096 [Neurospora tetraspora]|uniref:Uncharacterized protein n=1 Tax=Neurospora tetraspora TaxID=94610 RepID=A0AAE0JK14_9PEZI|nr:hypothetical protein B0H65DRAFT_107096 [Neurospora tetraspora]
MILYPLAWQSRTAPLYRRRRGLTLPSKKADAQPKICPEARPVIGDQVEGAQATNRNTVTEGGETAENRWLSVGPAVWSPVHGPVDFVECG